MKLSEKIQEDLREQQEINLSDPAVQTALRERVMDAIAEALGDAYDCTRHWSAWGYGTMSQDDFSLVADDSDRIGEIADAAIGTIGAQPAPSVPDGWLRAVDEALVTAHIGVANAHDTYEQAKAKLDNLIGFNVDVATDPAVNGGYKLMPVEPTTEMICEMERQWMCGSQIDMAKREWQAACAAAPEANP